MGLHHTPFISPNLERLDSHINLSHKLWFIKAPGAKPNPTIIWLSSGYEPSHSDVETNRVNSQKKPETGRKMEKEELRIEVLGGKI